MVRSSLIVGARIGARDVEPGVCWRSIENSGGLNNRERATFGIFVSSPRVSANESKSQGVQSTEKHDHDHGRCIPWDLYCARESEGDHHYSKQGCKTGS